MWWVIVFVVAGAVGSLWFNSLVPGALCLIMALCAYVYQALRKGE